MTEEKWPLGFKPERFRRTIVALTASLVFIVPAYAVALALVVADFDSTNASIILANSDPVRLATSSLIFTAPAIFAAFVMALPWFFDQPLNIAPIAVALLAFIAGASLTISTSGKDFAPSVDVLAIAYALLGAAITSLTVARRRVVHDPQDHFKDFEESWSKYLASLDTDDVDHLEEMPRGAEKIIKDAKKRTNLRRARRLRIAQIQTMVLVAALIPLSLMLLAQQPKVWVAFNGGVLPKQASWVSEGMGGTYYLRTSDPAEEGSRMQWHQGAPSALVYCIAMPTAVYKDDGTISRWRCSEGKYDSGEEDTPIPAITAGVPSPSAGSPSSTPAPSEG